MFGQKGDEGPRGFPGPPGPIGLQVNSCTVLPSTYKASLRNQEIVLFRNAVLIATMSCWD